jgi:hypothetical protein
MSVFGRTNTGRQQTEKVFDTSSPSLSLSLSWPSAKSGINAMTIDGWANRKQNKTSHVKIKPFRLTTCGDFHLGSTLWDGSRSFFFYFLKLFFLVGDCVARSPSLSNVCVPVGGWSRRFPVQ